MEQIFSEGLLRLKTKQTPASKSSISWQHQLANRNPIINRQTQFPSRETTVSPASPHHVPQGSIYLEPWGRPHLQKNLLGPKIGRARGGGRRERRKVWITLQVTLFLLWKFTPHGVPGWPSPKPVCLGLSSSGLLS